MRKILLLIIAILLLFSCSSKSGIEEKLPIPKEFKPSYKIVSDERLDYKWDGLDIMRKSYRITVPKCTNEEIKNNCRHLAIKTYQSGVYNVSIFVYNNRSEVNGQYTVALYEFCPYGDWGRTNEMYSARLKDYGENFRTR